MALGAPENFGLRGLVQCNRNNARLANIIVAQITSSTGLASSEPTQVLLDPSAPEGKLSGVHHVSAIKCENLATLPASDVRHVIGKLSGLLVAQLDEALKASLQLS